MTNIRDFDIDVTIDYDPSVVEWPFATTDSNGEVKQLFDNHMFEPVEAPGRLVAFDILAREEEHLAGLASGKLALTELQEAESEQIEEEPELRCEQPWLGFDLGVRAAVVALAELGAIPVTSCNGGCFDDDVGPPHLEAYPLIAFYSDADAAKLISDVARRTGCGLANSDRALVLYADKIAAFPRFARALLEALAHREARGRGH